MHEATKRCTLSFALVFLRLSLQLILGVRVAEPADDLIEIGHYRLHHCLLVLREELQHRQLQLSDVFLIIDEFKCFVGAGSRDFSHADALLVRILIIEVLEVDLVRSTIVFFEL